MSAQLIDHSPDLKKLRDEGYSVFVENGLLIIEDIPYLKSNKEVAAGKLVSKLVLGGEKAQYNNDHVAFFVGEVPHHADGTALNQIINNHNQTNLGNGIIANLTFSSKPPTGYKDYHHKMTTYINILQGPAVVIEPGTTARRYRVMQDETSAVFNYIDTNSSRASIMDISMKLAGYKIGIIGVGGTGSYILDFVAKTPVEEIHLFDGDEFYSHNAFRAPGAPELKILNRGLPKVDYLKGIYSSMHKGIVAHNVFINNEQLEKLASLNFVFVSIDEGNAKKKIFDYLDEHGIPYIDVGLGLDITDDNQLRGMIRTTSITSPERYSLKDSIPMEGDDEVYGTNIQIAELNALNASMAVISWKQYAGFYQSTFDVGQTVFNLDTMHLVRLYDAS